MADIDKDGENVWKETMLANAVTSLLQNKQYHIELINSLSELRWAKYNSLINAGFSEKDALFILVNTGIIE